MNVLERLQKMILLFLLGFPIIIICLIGFLSLTVLNVGTIFLFVGQVLIVPLTVALLHVITSIIPGTRVPASDVGLLVPSIRDAGMASSFNVAPSYWVAHVVFFCSYIFTNAYTVYNLDSATAGSAPWKIENRKGRSLMIMIVSLLSMGALILSRYVMTGAETVLGVIIGIGVFVPLAYYWYQIAIKNGSQNGDIFGIVQQIMPSIEEDTAATLCLKA
jgi:hypothetical protein